MQITFRLATWLRWFELGIYAVIGAVVAPRLGELGRRAMEFLFGPRIRFGSNPATVFAIIIAGTIALWGVKWFQPVFRHFRNSIRYPSGLWSVLAGFILFTLSDVRARPATFFESAAYLAPLIVFCGLVVGCLVYRARQSLRDRSNRIREANDLQSLENLSDAELLAWLDQQAAIDNESQDMFGAKVKAHRVLAALREPRDAAEGNTKRKTVAIVGPFGVGKTSVIHLVTSAAAKVDEKFIFAYTSCWGFETSTKAQENILDAAVRHLSAEIDCNSLRRLPEYYRDAVKETSGWLKPLLVWAVHAFDPQAQLERFEPFLDALNAHIVIVIEDLDRVPDDFDTSQIIAMLHYLRSVKRVSFILAVGHSTKVELSKVVDEIVFIDPLFPKQSLAVVNRVRDLALKEPDFIDAVELRGDPWNHPQRHSTRPKSLLTFRTEAELAQELFQRQTRSWAGDIGLLTGSPRTMKSALREFRMKWRVLWGEVDVDELLALCVLLHGMPDLYYFAIDHAEDFKELQHIESGDPEPNKDAAKVIRERLQQRLGKAIAGNFRERDAAASLLAGLFPGFASVSGHPGGGAPGRIQSVSGPRGSTYLRRIHSGSTDPSEQSEREILALMDAVGKGGAARIEAIAKLFSNDRIQPLFCELEEQLRCFDEEARLAVLSKLLAIVRQRDGRDASMHSDAIPQFYGWFPTSGGNPDVLSKWFAEEITTSLPDHPALAGGLIELVQKNHSLRELIPQLRKIVASKWSNLGVSDWARSLGGKYSRDALALVLRPLLTPTSVPPSELAWLPEKLLLAMEAHPQPMLLQAAWCFMGDSSKDETFFNASVVAGFFGAKALRFFNIIFESVESEPNPTPILTKIREAASYNILKHHKAQKEPDS